jgi:hypothetical protein
MQALSQWWIVLLSPPTTSELRRNSGTLQEQPWQPERAPRIELIVST